MGIKEDLWLVGSRSDKKKGAQTGNRIQSWVLRPYKMELCCSFNGITLNINGNIINITSRYTIIAYNDSYISRIIEYGIISGSNLWRYVSTIFLAIFYGDVPLHRPEK